VRKVVCRPEVKENRNRVALQYGPLVYCVEGKDNANNVWNVVMADQPQFETIYNPDLLGGVNTILFTANVAKVSSDGKSIVTVPQKMTAIPYYSWNNRGAGNMQVWLPTSIREVKINY
jgi:hypothetical protein